jgi:hypothetical protein
LDTFLPINKLTPSTNEIIHESFAIQRRHMTFAEAEKRRTYRTIPLSLLNAGDVVGLDSFVHDLATHPNTARCTAPCDLFYILKHNFDRLQKRYGTHGLIERLRECVMLSFVAYPRVVQELQLFRTLIKRHSSSFIDDEDAGDGKRSHSHQGKQSWLFHAPNVHSTVSQSVSSSINIVKFDSSCRVVQSPKRLIMIQHVESVCWLFITPIEI